MFICFIILAKIENENKVSSQIEQIPRYDVNLELFLDWEWGDGGGYFLSLNFFN